MNLDSKRMTIRPMRLEDAAAVLAYRSDAKTNKFQGFIPNSVEEVRSFINKLANIIDERETWFQFVLIEKKSNKIIGDLGLYFMAENEVEFGCTISLGYQGKGLATEALTIVKHYVFDVLNKSKLTASVDPRNVKSIRMLESIGMQKVSATKNAFILRGEWVDDVVYELKNNLSNERNFSLNSSNKK